MCPNRTGSGIRKGLVIMASAGSMSYLVIPLLDCWPLQGVGDLREDIFQGVKHLGGELQHSAWQLVATVPL